MVLFIKTSSLGDVIHQMPALTEARRHLPDARFAWVVEEAFAPLARLHPAAGLVLPVASRRWRRAPLSPATWREARTFLKALRAQQYDAVVDTQGLFRTGLIARAARGPRHGYDRASVRESAASWFYDQHHFVRRDLHAVMRNRLLTAQALGYAVEGEPDYGLHLDGVVPSRDAILLHATAQTGKEWPEDRWIALGREIAAQDRQVVLPWGNARERDRAERLAASIPNARVPDLMPLDRVARMIAAARVVVGVDTGLLHLAAALERPLVAIFTGSVPELTGPVGRGPMAVLGARGAPPSVAEVSAALARTAPSAQ